MKSSLIRPALALALAAGLAGCGGSDKAEFTVKGTVTGIAYPGMVLTTNGMEIAVAPPAKAGDPVTFEFPNKLEYGDVYDVQIKAPPAHQKECGTPPNTIPNFTDTAGRLAEINVTIACIIDSYTIGGTITGLTGAGLVLANGSTGGQLAVTLPTTPTTTPLTYSLPPVFYGQTYSLAIIKQPTGQVCTVTNPTGTMGDAKVENINITCVAAPS
jgi:hypothetical protein